MLLNPLELADLLGGFGSSKFKSEKSASKVDS